ncbi:hypothetical protein CCHR01_11088 [Colletotrichum chrysophilum]|uniref:Capsule synthesis protein CapA domain-containing protein n=1 Tax=Colletotrichum chrysophilum TaxID=1836956 RepID=A0AAD9EFD9_9PEZI|nr:hypothetical protein CCHR01_11088 [Colletotrichum chrysophilum]
MSPGRVGSMLGSLQDGLNRLASITIILHSAQLAFPVTLAASISNNAWSLVATGDLLGDVVTTNDSRTHVLWDITRSADFAFFNMEGQLFRDADFTGCPSSENGGDNDYGNVGGGPTYDPSQAFLLAGLGFNLASQANNHVWDYGFDGYHETKNNLEAANITSAGSGASLAEARNASFVQRGNTRLSLICAAGTHTPESVAGAGEPSDNLAPRPGVSALRTSLTTVVDGEAFSNILRIARAQGQSDLTDDVAEVTLYTGQSPMFWSSWRRADSNETTPKLDWNTNEDDFNGIISSIREAKATSDATVFSLHAHESDSGAYDSIIPLPPASTVPASYITNISRSAIEAGADVVLVHGPHHLRGIEIYQGRPIFYSLGSFTYSLGLHFRGVSLPIEWDDGLIAHSEFVNGTVTKVALYPTIHNQLTNDTSLADRTMPKLAPPAEAQRILNYLQEASRPFGTLISINGSTGYVHVSP